MLSIAVWCQALFQICYCNSSPSPRALTPCCPIHGVPTLPPATRCNQAGPRRRTRDIPLRLVLILIRPTRTLPRRRTAPPRRGQGRRRGARRGRGREVSLDVSGYTWETDGSAISAPPPRIEAGPGPVP